MQNSHTIAVFGILPDRNIDPVFPKYRCRDYLARAVRVRILRFFGIPEGYSRSARSP